MIIILSLLFYMILIVIKKCVKHWKLLLLLLIVFDCNSVRNCDNVHLSKAFIDRNGRFQNLLINKSCLTYFSRCLLYVQYSWTFCHFVQNFIFDEKFLQTKTLSYVKFCKYCCSFIHIELFSCPFVKHFYTRYAKKGRD